MHEYAFNRSNCALSSIGIFSLISSLGLFLTFILLLTTNSQFIAFNEFSSTGKTPPIYLIISIVLVVLNCSLFFTSFFAIWSTNDILNKWNRQILTISGFFIFVLALNGLVQVSAGVTVIVYMKTMPVPLREHMADNLRSNYTGGFGMGYLDRQFDRSVDWVQTNYQCCGVISYEDYRNGFYYNSFNKYTIVNIVPSSCCMYRELNQPSKCQMKSINIYRKGCYDILMWWMESFGVLIACLTISFGAVDLIASFFYAKIINQIKKFKAKVKQKQMENQIKRNLHKLKQLDDGFSDTNTMNESMSYVESKN